MELSCDEISFNTFGNMTYPTISYVYPNYIGMSVSLHYRVLPTENYNNYLIIMIGKCQMY